MNSVASMSKNVYQVETYLHKRTIPSFHCFLPYLDVRLNNVVVTLNSDLRFKKYTEREVVEAGAVQPPF